MLSPYRVLDLSDEKGLLCGKLLGDLGADVIKVERPGGDPARRLGPFFHDQVDPEKSLFWFAYNTSKRGITLDIEAAGGRELFRELLAEADLVIESFPPGYLDRLGLGYAALEKINPGIIVVSITPFGQTGPYRDYKAPDIVACAIGGQTYALGDLDRPPIRIGHHSQAYLNAGAEAAVGAMLALHHRRDTGEGQQVDVSIQESVVRCAYGVTESWDMLKTGYKVAGPVPGGSTPIRRVWPCMDGHVIWVWFGGPNARRWNLPLVGWMDDEGMANDFLKSFDWATFSLATVTPETADRLLRVTSRFFMTHTRAELLEGAVKYHVMLYPMATAADTVGSVQLAARHFWVEVDHPELGRTITYPGAFAHSTEAPPRISCRAPLIGEHNQAINSRRWLVERDEPAALRPTERHPATPRDDSLEIRAPGKPLEGVRVLDFSRNIAGPLASRTLANFGAEVIKLEGERRHDSMRMAGPFKDGIAGLNRAGRFNQYSSGKLSLTLNLAHPEGLKIAIRLVARSDIVLENFAGGVMDRMGLGYAELKKVKPDIIMLSSCMMGQTGPHATHLGVGHHLSALAGFNYVSGWPDRAPPYLGPYTDYPAANFNALAILAALDYRRRTGKGQYLDISQYENGVHFLAPLILDFVVNGRVAGAMGNRCADAAPHNAYRCRGEDRWCALAVFTEEEWHAFCRVIGRPSWTRDSRFSTLPARKENEEELDRLVEEWTITHPAEALMKMMQAAGVAAGVLATGEDLLERDPQLKHRHFFWELEHPEIGRYHAAGPSFVLAKSPPVLRPAPLLGEHNADILKGLLGMSEDEIADLIVEGVLE